MTVTVATTAINRLVGENGGGVFLLAKLEDTGGDLESAMVDVDTAIEHANSLTENDPDDPVWAASAFASAAGPIINLDWVGDPGQNTRWLQAFASELGRQGRVGAVTLAPQKHFPQSMQWPPTLAAQLAFTVSEPSPYGYPPFTWLVADAVTVRLARHATDWAATGSATGYLSEGIGQFGIDVEGAAEAFAGAIERSALAGLAFLKRRDHDIRLATTGPLGLAAYAASSAASTWIHHITDVTDVLRFHAPDLDIGFVRLRPACAALPYPDLGNPPLPYIRDYEWTGNRRLYPDYVPDAHGIQLLTRSHLNKANDLSGWTTNRVCEDRFLVQARDLEPWYSDLIPSHNGYGSEPRPEVLEAARREFGAMVLTRDVIEAEPDGLVHGQMGRPITQPKPEHPRNS